MTALPSWLKESFVVLALLSFSRAGEVKSTTHHHYTHSLQRFLPDMELAITSLLSKNVAVILLMWSS